MFLMFTKLNNFFYVIFLPYLSISWHFKVKIKNYFDETVFKTILYNEKIRILWLKDPDQDLVFSRIRIRIQVTQKYRIRNTGNVKAWKVFNIFENYSPQYPSGLCSVYTPDTRPVDW